MVGKKTELKAVPFFWRMFSCTGIKYSGHGAFDDVHIVGDLEKLNFVSFYLDKNEQVIVVTLAGMSVGPLAPSYVEYRTQGKTLYKSDLQLDHPAFMKLLNQ